jgi:2-polyprenyl-6-hydroxyphenyl methylase / 3-demethylubiquinone-9 3-methyltransferase
MPIAPARPRNDPAQYDDLAAQWWRSGGPFEALHWIAAARARAVPSATRVGAVLVDVACGGGLLAPHVAGLGYRHVGIDLSAPSLRQAAAHGVTPVCADARRLPLRDGVADVVVAGEMLEHVPDLPRVVRELARVLRPGGTLVTDTLADTATARFITITVGERIKGVPAGLHDGSLYVDRDRLRREAATQGVTLQLTGLRPALGDVLRWLLGRRGDVRLVPTRFTTVLFQAVGRKEFR